MHIAIAHGGHIHARTVEAVYNMRVPPGTQLFCDYGYNIAQTRTRAIRRAWQQDYLLFVDSDIVPGEDSLEQLLELDTDYATGVYLRKDSSTYELKPHTLDLPDQPFEVEAAGMGFFLIRMSAVHTANKRYFEYTAHTSEDIDWCSDKTVIAHPHCRVAHITQTLVE